MRGHETYSNWDWRDTAFVACSSDPQRIQEVLTEINKPLSERRMISGPIEYGHGGHNHNGPYWFGWHFTPNRWELVEVAMEVCDGRPYSDVELNTAFWVEQVGRFCPWASAPLREISVTNALYRPSVPIRLYPNPARNQITLSLQSCLPPVQLTLYNPLGQVVFQSYLPYPPQEIQLPDLKSGLYIVKIESPAFTGSTTLLILRE